MAKNNNNGWDAVKPYLASHFIFPVIIVALSLGITYYLNKANQAIQYDFSLKLSRQQTCEKTFEDLSSLINRRLYRMKRVLWEHRDDRHPAQSFREVELFHLHDEILDEWNSAHSRNANILEYRFNKECRTFYEEKIHNGFKNLLSRLDDIVNKTQHPDKDARKLALSNLEGDITTLSTDIDRFNVMLIESIEKINLP